MRKLTISIIRNCCMSFGFKNRKGIFNYFQQKEIVEAGTTHFVTGEVGSSRLELWEDVTRCLEIDEKG